MQLESHHLHELAESIWASMLGMEISPCELPEPWLAAAGEMVIGCIQITGDWQGALTLHCTGPLARAATSAMFDMEPEEVDDSLIQDAIGELTNMLGGNLKGLLPGTSRLSMPSVAEGSGCRISVSRSVVLKQAAFQCEGGAMLIVVHGPEVSE